MSHNYVAIRLRYDKDERRNVYDSYGFYDTLKEMMKAIDVAENGTPGDIILPMHIDDISDIDNRIRDIYVFDDSGSCVQTPISHGDVYASLNWIEYWRGNYSSMIKVAVDSGIRTRTICLSACSVARLCVHGSFNVKLMEEILSEAEIACLDRRKGQPILTGVIRDLSKNSIITTRSDECAIYACKILTYIDHPKSQIRSTANSVVLNCIESLVRTGQPIEEIKQEISDIIRSFISINDLLLAAVR